MDLSRRAAMSAVGAISAGTFVVGTARHYRHGRMDEDRVVEELYAAAEAIYPTSIDLDRGFIRTDVRGRLRERAAYADEQVAALATLDHHARRLTGRSFRSLSIDRRRTVLRRLGIQRAHPNPTGTEDERIRYYVVNDLLYVLFTSPVGGELVGCENPPGYPGGTDAYTRGPRS